MKVNLMNKAMCAAAALALTAAGLSASANAQSSITRTAEVQFGDLDLTTDDGKSTFHDRIKGAVRQVCGSFDSKSLVDMRDHGSCMQEARLSAKQASVTILAAAEAGELTQTAMFVRK